ncbi:MAG: hypothetical exported protein [Marine Group I thaumarchaeote]|nr:MAG: hypothetical exported protein [Marine Group I thaumarchaeote]
MKNLLISIILIATVLIAGFFAFSPVEKASTVHTQIIASAQEGALSTTISLDGIIADGVTSTNVVLIDATNIGNILEGHFAAVLPDDDNACTAGGNPDANIRILVGVAGVELDDDVLAGSDTSIVGGPDVTFAGNTRSLCLFHADFSTADTDQGTITDVVLQLVDGSLPDNAVITVAVDIDDTES